MPVLKSSQYKAPLFFHSGHIQTIYPTLFRSVRGLEYNRERIDTPDGDFLDLDWSRVQSERCVIISHGLEGNSSRHYVTGMVQFMNRYGIDALAWNFRGCSGEMNRKPEFYHSGASHDLETVVNHVVSLDKYKEIALIGFSLGGNMTLKYFGEKGSDVPEPVTHAITYSVPCDLVSSVDKINTSARGVYMLRFLNMLKNKVILKANEMPDRVSADGLDKIKTLIEFDDRYTAPIHGFKDAWDYYEKASCKQFLSGIRRPTLLINAKNDPFLSEACYPDAESDANPCLFLEKPDSGGHVGFMEFSGTGYYWSEKRALEFLKMQNKGL